jgi:hypothetical protein
VPPDAVTTFPGVVKSLPACSPTLVAFGFSAAGAFWASELLYDEAVESVAALLVLSVRTITGIDMNRADSKLAKSNPGHSAAETLCDLLVDNALGCMEKDFNDLTNRVEFAMCWDHPLSGVWRRAG